jgi:hypothetical protein
MLVLDMQVMKKYLDHGYRIAQPLINYALGWLSPELLGTGFVINSIDDHHISGTIPYSKFNSNRQLEIHAGLVINSGFELIRQLLVHHVGHDNFHIESFETTLKKNDIWNKPLQLKLELDEVILDRFFMELQKNVTAQLKFDISVQKKSNKSLVNDSVKTKDIIKFILIVRGSKKLLA